MTVVLVVLDFGIVTMLTLVSSIVNGVQDRFLHKSLKMILNSLFTIPLHFDLNFMSFSNENYAENFGLRPLKGKGFIIDM